MDRFLGGVDVFHAVNYVLPPIKRAKTVLTIHDLGFLRDPSWFSPKIMRPFRRTIRRDACRADVVIAVSEATKADIVSYLDINPEKIHVIYEAADSTFIPTPREIAEQQVRKAFRLSGPYILCVGAVEARKNITGLLAAFSELRLPHNLVIVGSPGWRSEEVFAATSRLQLSKKVLFTGYLRDRTLLPSLYSAADAFVFPSWHEGFGLPLLEAMSCGCPVICSNRSSLPEIGGDAPVYFNPEDKKELRNKLETVLGDASQRMLMRQEGFTQVRKFSWEKCARETLACYQETR